MNINDHVGKLLIALDVNAGVSPAIEAVVEPGTDPAPLVTALNEALINVLNRYLPNWERVLYQDKPFFVLHGRTGIIDTPEERVRKFEELLRPTQEAFAEADNKFEEWLDTHPDAQQSGWWQVNGIRHNALVRADNAREALEKATEIVDSWEMPEPVFIGVELPEIMRL